MLAEAEGEKETEWEQVEVAVGVVSLLALYTLYIHDISCLARPQIASDKRA